MATSKSNLVKCGSSLSISVPPRNPISSDVYLSFRSTDISKTFVDHLCMAFKSDGIPTIYFDSELGEEKMFSRMPQEVQMSNFIIIVLSENYASSRWCLDELVEILGSKRRRERLQTVVPIFYHVDPADVIHQTGKFGTAFQRFKDMENKEVETWKAALIEVGNLSGYHLPLLQRRLESIYISEIVKRVKTGKRIYTSEMFESNFSYGRMVRGPSNLTIRPFGASDAMRIFRWPQNYDLSNRSLGTREGLMLRLRNDDKLAKSRVHEKDEDEPDAKRREEVQLDFPGSDYTLFDIKEFLGLMENVLEYKLPKSKSMAVRNLKVLHIRNINLSDIPDNLSFPDLENLFLQSNIDSVSISSSIFERIPALRVLDMSNTSIKILPPSFSKLIKLEKLVLHGCQFLTELPHDIGAIVNLDFLDLSGCTKLAEIAESINLLKRLSTVVLKDCKSLTELPEGISKLRSLRYLSLSGCENLAEIPESIALLENLSSLNLTDCKSLTKLPESIRELRSLKFFYLSGCSSLIEFHAPEVSIHTISASSQADEMEVLLDIHNYEATLLDITELLVLLEKVVQYEFLKSKIVAVRSLKVIHIKNSKLPEFPDDLIFPDLEKLFLQPSLHMSYIPSSFFMKMPALKVLDMSNTSIKTLPPTVSELFVLEQLILRGCELLMELPPEISALGNLRVLDLEGTGLVCLPDELKELTSLKCLKVSLYNAESYRESKKIVSVIPRETLSKLTQLEELSINADPQDVWCSAAMKAIMEDLPSLRMLKNLKLYLPTTELLKNLMELKWDNDDLPIYQNLSNFSVIIGPRAEHFISRLTCDLEEEFLKLKKCLKYINGENDTTHFAEALKHANALYLDRHWTIQKLSIFNLKESNELKFCLLVDCNEMQSIFDGGDFNCRVADIGENHLSLQYLAIHYLKNLEVIWNRPGVGCCLHSLKVLVLHMCPYLTTIFTPVLLGDLNNLKEITVEDCPKLTNLITEDSTQLTSKDTLPRLKRLSLFYLPELVSISSGISIGPELANIVIYDCPKLKRLPSLAVCNKEVIEIKGESEWWNALEWNEPEWNGGQPAYLHRAFSELDIEGDSMDELVPQYGNSLCLFAEECDAS